MFHHLQRQRVVPETHDQVSQKAMYHMIPEAAVCYILKIPQNRLKWIKPSEQNRTNMSAKPGFHNRVSNKWVKRHVYSKVFALFLAIVFAT